jgi:hypothetical protein
LFPHDAVADRSHDSSGVSGSSSGAHIPITNLSITELYSDRSSKPDLREAEQLVQMIVNVYPHPNMTAEQIQSQAMDGNNPLRQSSDACRTELDSLQKQLYRPLDSQNEQQESEPGLVTFGRRGRHEPRRSSSRPGSRLAPFCNRDMCRPSFRTGNHFTLFVIKR